MGTAVAELKVMAMTRVIEATSYSEIWLQGEESL